MMSTPSGLLWLFIATLSAVGMSSPALQAPYSSSASQDVIHGSVVKERIGIDWQAAISVPNIDQWALNGAGDVAAIKVSTMNTGNDTQVPSPLRAKK